MGRDLCLDLTPQVGIAMPSLNDPGDGPGDWQTSDSGDSILDELILSFSQYGGLVGTH